MEFKCSFPLYDMSKWLLQDNMIDVAEIHSRYDHHNKRLYPLYMNTSILLVKSQVIL